MSKPDYRTNEKAWRDLTGQYVVINESRPKFLGYEGGACYPVVSDEPTTEPTLFDAVSEWMWVEDEQGEAAHIGIYQLVRVDATPELLAEIASQRQAQEEADRAQEDA